MNLSGLRDRARRAVLPDHVYRPLRFELSMLKLRIKADAEVARFRGQSGLLVNVGCGTRGRPGFVNVDGSARESVDCVYDCRTSLPFANGSVRGIFSEHFFEHLHYEEEAPAFLNECRRVLQAGGVLRLVVPDAGRYLMAYAAGGWRELAKMRGLTEDHVDPWLATRYATPMELVNAVFRQYVEHKFAYDAETMIALLERHGFSARASAFGESSLAELAIDSADRAPESLYVEARPA